MSLVYTQKTTKKHQTLIKAYLNMPNKKKSVCSRFEKKISRETEPNHFFLSSPHRSFMGNNRL